MKQLLKQIILEQNSENVSTMITRHFPKRLITCKEIIVISGIRRCGKSVLLRQISKSLPEQEFYFNFDDERLIGFTVEHFQDLHEVLIELFGAQKTFYFDEIQNVVGWERFVRRLYDSGNKVFVTGSNATMLSRELGTHLTGRFIPYELNPFSFSEYLAFTAHSFTDNDLITTKGRALLRNAFGRYFTEGGFPQYLENRDNEYLKALYESILYRDVMVRNNLTNEKEIRELAVYLASNVSKLSSNNSLARTIGIKNPTTIKNYLEYIGNTYMIFQTAKYDYSLKKQLHNPKKTYFIDNAMVLRLGFSFSGNHGRLLENLVANNLRRLGKEIYYYHNGNSECDFLVREKSEISEAIQVCYTLANDELRKREIGGLIAAMDDFGVSKGYIITMDEEFLIEDYPSKKVSVIPAWKWCLLSGKDSYPF